MSKQDKQSIQEKLQNRSPMGMREVIKPVDMLAADPEPPNERTNEETNERTDERMIKRTKERTRVRHSFDIYQDQLLSLKEISLARQKTLGERSLLGDLVQEALDTFIKNEQTNVRTNE